jgi:predicted ester cyclase
MDALAKLFTPDTFDHVGQRAGPESWREVYSFLCATLPGWQWTLDDLVAEDDRVVARLTVRGTHLGSEIPFLRGIAPPDGRWHGPITTASDW